MTALALRRLAPLNLSRLAFLAVTATLIAVALGWLAFVLVSQAQRGWLGGDFALYRSFAEQALATGHPYTPDPNAPELAGQYRYPPTALYLFVAFEFIPWPLWWIVPLSVTAYIVWSYRPPAWFWPLVPITLMVSNFYVTVGAGNTDMWVLMVIALATRWPAASWLLVAKPSALPFTLPFIARRGWWIGLALAALVSLPFLPLWFDWLRVVPLYHGTQGPVWLYGYINWPVLLLPLLAWRFRLRSTAS